VLKIYKSPAKSLADPFARVFTAVKSPMTHGSFEFGDSYVTAVPGLRKWLAEWIVAQRA